MNENETSRGSLRRSLVLLRLNEICSEEHLPEPFGSLFRTGAEILTGKGGTSVSCEGILGVFMKMLPEARRLLDAGKETGTAYCETFIGLYNFLERECPDEDALRRFLYWPVFDYAEVYLPDRLGAMLNPVSIRPEGERNAEAERIVASYTEKFPDKKGVIISGKDDLLTRSVIQEAARRQLLVCAPQKSAIPLLGILGMPGIGERCEIEENLSFLMDGRMISRMTGVLRETLRGRKIPFGVLYVDEKAVYPKTPELKSLWDQERHLLKQHQIDL